MAAVTSLKTRLRKILIKGFPGAEVILHDGSSVGKLGGTLIWDGFVGKDQIDRQRAVRDLLRTHLDVDQYAKLSAIFTMTPDEMTVMRESSEDR